MDNEEQHIFKMDDIRSVQKIEPDEIYHQKSPKSNVSDFFTRRLRAKGSSVIDPSNGRMENLTKKTSNWDLNSINGHGPLYHGQKNIYTMIQQAENRNAPLQSGPKFGERSLDDLGNFNTGKLWVDKYSPEKFTELASNDKTNVEVLKWVSQWKDVEAKLMASKNDSSDPRPDRKIMIIAGPPGYGKTTLVQVVAKVAGYNLVEINASDERTGDMVIQKINTAINSNTLASKPNMILIDEIDGAANTSSEVGLITYLAKLCSSVDSEKKNTTKTVIEDGTTEDDTILSEKALKSQARGSSARKLCRPIICVCNNLYAPALRPLRQIATVIQLRKPSPVILSRRLKEICDLEGFKIDSKSLVDLCEMMECDLRACLHSLQFLSTTKRQVLGSSDFLKSMASGLKDLGKTEFSVVGEIFNKSGNSGAKDLGSMIRKLSNNEDRLVDSCHQIFLHTRFFDDAQLSKVNLAFEWLGCADIWRSSSKGQFQLNSYVQFTPVKFNQLFASTAGSIDPFEFSKLDLEVAQKAKKNESILNEYVQGICPVIRSNCGGLTETILLRAPLLQQIIKPSIKSPNPQLLKPGEKLHLAKIVRIMASEKLTYLETRCENGSYFFSLNPSIDKLTCFSLESVVVSNCDSAVRKLIAHEVQQENIRKSQSRQSVPADNKGAVEKLLPVKRKEVSLIQKAVKRDFFGRIIAVIEDDEGGDENGTKKEKQKIFYKFNEGFSNAVRRTIKIKDLLPS